MTLYTTRWLVRHREEFGAYLRKRRMIAKVKTVWHYSNRTFQCSDPFRMHDRPFRDVRALTVVRVHGSGEKKTASYSWLVKHRYPGDYKVLCMNCLWIEKAKRREWGPGRKRKYTGNIPPPLPKRRRKNTMISSFVLGTKRYDVDSWREVLLKLCSLLYQRHPVRFRRLLRLTGRKRPYFSRRRKDLKTPLLIEGSDVYVEGNWSSVGIVSICRKILAVLEEREKFRVSA